MATELISFRLPDYVIRKLDQIAEETGRSKSYYLKKSIMEFIEDREDYIMAIAALEESDERFTLEEVRAYLDLDN